MDTIALSSCINLNKQVATSQSRVPSSIANQARTSIFLVTSDISIATSETSCRPIFATSCSPLLSLCSSNPLALSRSSLFSVFPLVGSLSLGLLSRFCERGFFFLFWLDCLFLRRCPFSRCVRGARRLRSQQEWIGFSGRFDSSFGRRLDRSLSDTLCRSSFGSRFRSRFD